MFGPVSRRGAHGHNKRASPSETTIEERRRFVVRGSRGVISWLIALAAVICGCDAGLPDGSRTRPDGTPCPANTLFCLGPDRDTCGEDRLSNPTRCGACFVRCFDTPESTAQCRGGRCERRCREPLADCDRDPTTACDTDIWTDARNCGGCGRTCAAGESCAAGRCVALSVRLKAPISAWRLPTARPWFRWELASGADGARIEVCATRTCETVEHRWDVTGESFRPPLPLSPGVHFWRATARYGEALDASPSPPWEFAIAPPFVAGVLADVNGDGVADDAQVVFHGNVSWEANPKGFRTGVTYSPAGPIALGDVNGDGFGDVGFFESALGLGWGQGETERIDLYVYRGGPSGAALAPLRAPIGSGVPWTGYGTRLTPIVDRDGDGYGDLFVSLPQYGPTYGIEISGRTLMAYRDQSLDYLLAPAHGDVNADGAEDLLSWWELVGGGVSSFGVHMGASRRPLPPGVSLGACGVPDASEARYSAAFRLTDLDDDGYDDLILRSASSPFDFLYPGGPMGLDGSRCVVIAR
ncbi:MAG: hypothetical protein U0326_02435 [Polyangiales bacterium]